MKVLLIEDNIEIINLVIELAKKHNFKIEVGHNTTDYINLTKRFRFAYIFCDINLDYAKEGFDIVKIHKKRRLKSKIIAFTSSLFSKDVISQSGFDYVLEKKPDKFIDFISHLAV